MKKMLSKVLTDSNTIDTSKEIAEVLVDSIFKDGLLKDLPIIGTITGVGKAISSVRDKLFIEKLKSFLYEFSNVHPDEISAVIESIDSSNDYKIKVGNKLVYIIDEAKDTDTAEYIGKWFLAFATKKVNYSQFLRGVGVIQNVFLKDFDKFILLNENEITSVSDKKGGWQVSEFQYNLINVGLCMLDLREISDFQKRQNLRMTNGIPEDSYNSHKSRIGARTLNDLLITEIGHILKVHFQQGKE